MQMKIIQSACQLQRTVKNSLSLMMIIKTKIKQVKNKTHFLKIIWALRRNKQKYYKNKSTQM